MSLDVQIEVKGSYVHLHCRGTFSVAAGLEVYAKAFEVAARGGRDRVLIDATGIEGVPPTTMERYEMGARAAQFFMKQAQRIRIAVVGKEPFVDPNRFAETVAANRGANGRVFTDVLEAVAWLEKEPGKETGG